MEFDSTSASSGFMMFLEERLRMNVDYGARDHARALCVHSKTQ